jgi:hypothetical protein
LLAVVVLAQLRRHLPHERVFRGVELRPPGGDGGQEGRPVGLAREEAGGRGSLDSSALAAYEEALFPRSESEAADAYLILDLCLGDRAPFGLIDFFTGAAAGE